MRRCGNPLNGGRPVDAHVQDHAVRPIGRRLLIWIAVAAAKVHVEVARLIRLNLHERAAQLDVAHRVVRIDDEHAHRTGCAAGYGTSHGWWCA